MALASSKIGSGTATVVTTGWTHFSKYVNVPADASPGKQRIEIVGSVSHQTTTVSFIVT